MILTVIGLDKRAMDHVEGHTREKQLNSRVWMNLYFSGMPFHPLYKCDNSEKSK